MFQIECMYYTILHVLGLWSPQSIPGCDRSLELYTDLSLLQITWLFMEVTPMKIGNGGNPDLPWLCLFTNAGCGFTLIILDICKERALLFKVCMGVLT